MHNPDGDEAAALSNGRVVVDRGPLGTDTGVDPVVWGAPQVNPSLFEAMERMDGQFCAHAKISLQEMVSRSLQLPHEPMTCQKAELPAGNRAQVRSTYLCTHGRYASTSGLTGRESAEPRRSYFMGHGYIVPSGADTPDVKVIKRPAPPA